LKYTFVRPTLVGMETTALHTDPRELTPDRRVPVSFVAHLFPVGRFGRPRLPATIARYVRDGVTVDGTVIRLEGGIDTDGRRWWTTAGAVERFLKRLTEARMGGVAAPARPSRASLEFQRLRNAARPGRAR
jgi:hypothetical protein